MSDSASTPPPGGSTPPPGENTPPPGESTPPPGGNTPPPGENTPPPGGNTPPPGENTPPPAAATTALAADKGGGAPPSGEDEKEVEAFASAMLPDGKPFEIGDGFSFDAEDAKALAPMVKAAGFDAAAGGKIARILTAYNTAAFSALEAQRAQEERAASTRCIDHFGSSWNQRRSEALKGGEALFGADLFSRLASDPRYGSDPAFIEALATYGRSVSDDRGIRGADSGGAPEDFASRWTRQR